MRLVLAVALSLLACEQPTKPAEVVVTPTVSATPIVSAAPAPTPTVTQTAGPIRWTTDPRAALAEAKKQQRGTFMYFHAEWCAACKEIERELDATFVKNTLAEKFVAVRIDMTDDDAPDAIKAKERYKIVGLPTMIVFDKDGQEVGRATEYLNAAGMKKLLRSSAY